VASRALERPSLDLDSALYQIGAYFMGESPVQKAAYAIARALDELGIEHAIAGALSLAAHGVVRATEDVDILIARDDLERFKTAYVGRGYVNLRAGGKAVRDISTGVKIDFLIAGDFPGDGKPKPVAFPRPSTASEIAGGFRVVTLPRLVELKLASGMTAPHRLQDLADVQRLIEVRALPSSFRDELHPFVREKYDELWQSAQHEPDDY
jgi:hypothetical protein